MPVKLFGSPFISVRPANQQQLETSVIRGGFQVGRIGGAWFPAQGIASVSPYIWIDPTDYTQVWITNHTAYPGAVALSTDISGTCAKVTSKGSASSTLYYNTGSAPDCPQWALLGKSNGGTLTRSATPTHNYITWPNNFVLNTSQDFCYARAVAIPAAGIGGSYEDSAGNARWTQTSTTALLMVNDANGQVTINHAALDTNWHILVLRRIGNTVTRFLDGVIDGVITITGSFTFTLNGTGPGFVRFLQCSDGELIVFANTTVQDSDVQNSIVPYLRARYGTP